MIPAGTPRRQYNQSDVVEKRIVINTPAPELGRCWDFGLTVAPNGDSHYGNHSGASEVDDGALFTA